MDSGPRAEARDRNDKRKSGRAHAKPVGRKPRRSDADRVGEPELARREQRPRPQAVPRQDALMRIVGGQLRGRALAAPKSQAVRPTADRLREALFNILAHAYGDPVTGARVLDLFAGTGALGLEALSRGAAFALFVDDGAEARALIRENVAALGPRRRHQHLPPRRDQARRRRIRSSRSRSSFSIRPMGRAWPSRRSPSARAGGWLTRDALIVVEEAAKAGFAAPDGFRGARAAPL